MNDHYVKLGVSLAVSLVLMFVLTMSMIDTIDHFHLNLSNAWMALIMVAPMGIVMLVVMWGMFKDQQLNYLLLGGFTVLFLAALWLGRSSALVGDEQFLRSMIPHHSRAILVCQESDITDPEIIELCDAIIETQREEIRQMEEILERY
jgi:uncharacterized protein (DUF305 family)